MQSVRLAVRGGDNDDVAFDKDTVKRAHLDGDMFVVALIPSLRFRGPRSSWTAARVNQQKKQPRT